MESSRRTTIWLFCVTSIVATTGFVQNSAQTGTDVRNLYTYLFTTSGYNKDVRPAQNQSAPTSVSVQLLLTGFLGLQETSQQMNAVGILTIQWRDDFLSWTPASYGGVTFIDVPQGLVWKPDLQVQNSLSSFTELGGSFMNVRVSSNGDISWKPYVVFDTKCLMNIKFFPFDKQVCSINIVAWNSDNSTVMLTKGPVPFEVDDDLTGGHWTISDPKAETLIDDGMSFIIYMLTFTRKPKIYIFNIIIPMAFLVVLDIFTFIIPNDSGEKLSFSVAVLLSIFILMTVVTSLLPISSAATSYLEIFLLIDTGLGTLILIIVVISLRIHQRPKEMKIPGCVRALTLLSWRLGCRMTQNATKNDEYYVTKIQVTSFSGGDKQKWVKEKKKERKREPVIVLWTDVTSAIDFYMFWLFLIVFVISKIVLLFLTVSN